MKTKFASLAAILFLKQRTSKESTHREALRYPQSAVLQTSALSLLCPIPPTTTSIRRSGEMFSIYRCFRPRLLNSLQTLIVLFINGLSLTAQPNGWADIRQRANDLHKNGQILEAELVLTDNVKVARKRDETSSGLAEALSDLGTLHHDSARLSEAERAYKESTFLWERIPGTHPNYGVTLGNFAALRLAQGRPSDALKLYRRAAEILVSSYGAASPQLGWVSCGLADVYWELGRYNDATSRRSKVS